MGSTMWSTIVPTASCSPVERGVAHRVVTAMWLVACVVLCWGSRQRVSVMTTSSTSSSSSSVSFVRASLLLPACLHVPVGFEGVVVMIRCVRGAWATLGAWEPSLVVVGAKDIGPNKWDVGLIIHQLLHTLGVGHTQNRPGPQIIYFNVECR